jgi:uncharacterized protein
MHDVGIALIGGLLVGMTLAVTGGGGSMVAIPVLTVGLGLPMATAAPISLIIVGLSAVAGWWEAARKGELFWNAIGRFLLAAIPLLIVARLLASRLPDAWTAGGFGMLALWIALRPPQTTTNMEPIAAPRFYAMAAATGALAGLLGAGGGFLITSALAFGAGLGLCAAIPNSLVIITAFGLVGMLSTLGRFTMSGMSSAPLLMLVVAVMTGLLGARWRSRLAPERVKLAFRLVVGTAALIMLAKAAILMRG